jgi:hypothetical protein
MDLQEVGWAMDWIDQAKDMERLRAYVNMVRHFLISQNVGNFLTS